MSSLVFTDSNFNSEVLESQRTVLVDFWAPWCGPCKIVGPIIDEIAEKKKDLIKIGKLNVDENPLTSSKFSIISIPTIKIFKDGKEVDSIIGAQPREVIEVRIDKALNG